MSWWLELHCDAGGIGGHFPDCASFKHDHPMAGSSNLENLKKHLSSSAKEIGWKKTRQGWVCPKCAAAERKAPEKS